MSGFRQSIGLMPVGGLHLGLMLSLMQRYPPLGWISGHGSPWELGWERTLELAMVDNSLGLSGV